MADAAVVAAKLEQIEQYHGELLSMQDVSRSAFLDDVATRRAVERMFENAIQAAPTSPSTWPLTTSATRAGRPGAPWRSSPTRA